MKTIHIHTTFAKLAALASLATLALLAASCTAEYDPGQNSPEAMAGAPIAISVAPPPAFTEVAATTRGNTAATNDLPPATRASQTDEGTQWEAGDILWLTAEFYEDKETADVKNPGNSTQISALKYTGTAWRTLSPKEAEEIGANILPDFVRQLHWPKEIEGWKAPVMRLQAKYLGDGKPDADGLIIITPEGKAPTTPTLYSEPTWVTPDEASTKLELRNGNTRLLIPAGYSVKGATYTYKTYINERGSLHPDRDPISAQPEDTYMFVFDTSTIELEKDGKEIAFTLPSITDEEGKPTRQGVSYTLTPYTNGTEAPLAPGTYDLLISNEKGLRDFAEKVNKDEKIDGPNGRVPAREAKVLQTANITLGAEEWTPIGNGQFVFRGRYNGNGHTIENMTITKGIQVDDPDWGKYISTGMFRSITNAVLTGINLRNVKIDINTDNTIYEVKVGCLAGETNNSTISLCSATGQVTVIGAPYEQVHTGGITGYNYLSTISRCRAAVEITATNTNAKGTANAGGIVGFNLGFILSCEAQDKTVTANSTNTANAGGIAGTNDNYKGYIAFCRAGNAVYAKNGGNANGAGGLIGYNGGYLYASYAHPNAKATSSGNSNYAGSLVGNNNEQPDRVQHCYGAGTASPNNSDLAAVANNIVYNRNPAAGEILTLMQMHTDVLESITHGVAPLYLTTTRYDPSASPAYGIEPICVKWTSRAWKQGSDPKYPEIDREYQGE